MKSKKETPSLEEVCMRVAHNMPLNFAQAMIYCNCKNTHMFNLISILRKNGYTIDSSCLYVNDLNNAIQLWKTHKKQLQDFTQSEKTHKTTLRTQFADKLKKLPKPTAQPIPTQANSLKLKPSVSLRFAEE